MQNFIIMTDSCCDLNAQEVAELGIRVLPLTFVMDGKSYLDTPDHAQMSPEEFYRRVSAGADCSTSAVSVGEFLAAMREELSAGRDILCSAFSSALSTTYQSACIAADDLKSEFPDRKVIVVDSRAASRGQGMLVWRTVQEMRKNDLSLEETADFVRGAFPHQCHWFTVEDLNHLKRGGRVSSTAALFGTMLNIKPVLH
ncbi:MAG: DegV family protein, partial [Oscillibacter sp.]|nr:DegV family protein [Oscillibacter sp.]